MKVNANSISWGLSPSKNHSSPDPGESYLSLIKDHQVFYIGNPNEKKVYLTFDLGYEAGFTESVLDTLKGTSCEAMFFVTGHYLNQNPAIIKRMVSEGHIVGNHTWNHPDITTLKDSKLEEELTKIENKYTQITGQKMEKFFRPP